MVNSKLLLAALCPLLLMPLYSATAQELAVKDLNGDGIVSYLAFGDSLTAGVGDGIEPGEIVPDLDGTARYEGGGYPGRIARLAGIAVDNAGVPGENFFPDGVARFPELAPASSADLVSILEGTNDAIHLLSSLKYRRYMQRVINVSGAIPKDTLLITIPPPCCLHAGGSPHVRAYNAELRLLAQWNGLRLVDLERAWNTTCSSQSECELFNLPEGEHPNRLGYDVIAQTVLATLYGVDIFAPEGAAELESALGLAAGSVVVKPDVVSQP